MSAVAAGLGIKRDITWVRNMFFWIVVAAMAAVQVVIIATALRMRIASDPDRGILGARSTEVFWTLLPALLLAAVIVLSFQTFRGE